MFLEDLLLQYSKTNQATCRGCKSKILIGEPRLGVESLYDEDEKVIHMWNHIQCFSMGKKYRDVNPVLIKGFEVLSQDHQQQIKNHFESGGVNINAVNKKKKPQKNKKKKQTTSRRSNSNQNKRKNSKQSTSKNNQLSGSEENNSSEEESDDEQMSSQDSENSEEEEEYKINKNRKSKISERNQRGRSKNSKDLSDIDEHDDEQISSKSKNRKSNNTNKNKIKTKSMNAEKEKPERMKYYILGYSYAQYDKYLDIFENLEIFDDDQLQKKLQANNQSTFGNRDKLLHRCADGKLLGAIPKCPGCKKGQLDFNYNDAVYKCTGYILNDDIKFCSKKYDQDEIKRVEWIDTN